MDGYINGPGLYLMSDNGPMATYHRLPFIHLKATWGDSKELVVMGVDADGNETPITVPGCGNITDVEIDYQWTDTTDITGGGFRTEGEPLQWREHHLFFENGFVLHIHEQQCLQAAQRGGFRVGHPMGGFNSDWPSPDEPCKACADLQAAYESCREKKAELERKVHQQRGALRAAQTEIERLRGNLSEALKTIDAQSGTIERMRPLVELVTNPENWRYDDPNDGYQGGWSPIWIFGGQGKLRELVEAYRENGF